MEMDNKMNIYLVNSLLLLKTRCKTSRFGQIHNSIDIMFMKMKMFMKQINCKVSSNKSQNKQLLQDGPSNKSTQWLCSNFAGHCNSIFGQNHSEWEGGPASSRGSLTLGSECCPQKRSQRQSTRSVRGPRAHSGAAAGGARARSQEPAALTQPRSFGAKTSKGGAAAYPWTGRAGSLLQIERFTMYCLSIACCLYYATGWSEVYNNDCSCSNPVRMISTGWGSGWYPQAGEADDIHRLLC